MPILKEILNWIKANPVNVACVIIMLACISAPFWLIMPARAKSRDKLEAKAKFSKQLERMTHNTVEVPNNDPEQPTIGIRLAINESVVKEMSKIYNQMTGNFDRLSKRVVELNRDGLGGAFAHEQLIEGFFPDAEEGQRYRIREQYEKQLQALHARLVSGIPPKKEEIAVKVAPAANEILPTSAEEREAKLKQRAEKYIEELKKQLSQFQMYAAPAPVLLVGESDQQVNPSIFTVPAIVIKDIEPTPAQSWEIQMNFWVQEDIVNAIVHANNKTAGSVLSNPVKELISIQVDPRYLGIAHRVPQGPEPTVADPSTPLPNNFAVSQTGRTSNQLYDVRQANVVMVVDMDQLPTVLNAFAEANLLTPIISKVTALDQELALTEKNKLYGNNINVAVVEVAVQSLWMRRWTAGHTNEEVAGNMLEKFDPGLMPDQVRWQLGLQPRDENFVPTATDAQGAPIAPSGDGYDSGGSGDYGDDYGDGYDDDYGA